MTTLGSGLIRILCVVIGLILLAAVVVPSQWSTKDRPLIDLIYPAALWVFMLLAALLPGLLMRPRSDRRFIAIAVGVFLVTRLVWVLIVPTLPFSDFEEYNNWAVRFGQFQPIHGDMFRLSINLVMQPWLYPISLGILYDVFGSHLIVGELFNVAAGALSTWLLFVLANDLFGPQVARFSAVLFVLWPTQLTFTSVLAAEHLALLFCLGAFVFMLPVLRSEPNSYRKPILGGICLGLSFVTRYTAMLALPSFILALLLTKHSLKLKTLRAVVFAVAFLLTVGLYVGLVAAIWQQVSLPHGGLTLMAGANPATGGTYTPDDTILYQSQPTVEDADRFARAEAVRRIRANPSGFVSRMEDKVILYWKDGFYGPQFSTHDLTPGRVSSFLQAHERSLLAISQFFHLTILLCAIVGCVFILLRGSDARLAMLLLFLVAGSLLHSIIIVHSRFNFGTIPVLIIFAAYGTLSLGSVARLAFTRSLASIGNVTVNAGQGLNDRNGVPLAVANADMAVPSESSLKNTGSRLRALVTASIIALALLTLIILVLHRSPSPETPTALTPASSPINVPSVQTPGSRIIAHPNPIKVCDGSGLGVTNVSYSFPEGILAEVHVNAPDGPLMARSGATGTATTGKWVASGTAFFLQNVTGGKPLTLKNTLATVSVKLTTDGCQ